MRCMNLLIVDLRWSLAYFMMIHPLPVAGKLPLKSLVTTNKEIVSERERKTNITCYKHIYTIGKWCIMVVTIAIFVSTFLTSLVIIFIGGFLCGLRFSWKVRGCIQSGKDFLSTSSPAPMYELAVVPAVSYKQQEQGVELKENVAYM